MAGKRKKYDKIDVDTIEEILKDVGTGTSLMEASRKRGIDEGAVRYRLQTDPRLSSSYARARVNQARAQFEEMQHLEERVLTGDLDPNAYRVVCDSRKWRLAKLHPSEYGDKQQVELSGTVDIAQRIVQSRRQAQIESVETVETVESTVSQAELPLD